MVDLFERRIVWRVAHNTAIGSDARLHRRIALRKTKIEEDNLIIGGQFQVLRLDIAVQHQRLLAVQIFERM